jgi:hypothetical protein
MTQGNVTKVVVFAGLLAVVGFAMPHDAAAQTAKKLNCNGCIKSKQIKNGKVKAKDLHSSAAPAGTAFDLIAQPGPIGPDEIVNTVDLEAPGDGYAILNASGYFLFTGAATDIQCTITQGTTTSFPRMRANGDSGQNERIPYAGVHALPVTAGTNTFNVVCNTGGTVSIFDASLVATFVPQMYSPPPPDPAPENGSMPDARRG